MHDHRQVLLLAIAKGEKLAALDSLDETAARQLAVIIRQMKDELAALQALNDRQ